MHKSPSKLTKLFYFNYLKLIIFLNLHYFDSKCSEASAPHPRKSGRPWRMRLNIIQPPSSLPLSHRAHAEQRAGIPRLSVGRSKRNQILEVEVTSKACVVPRRLDTCPVQVIYAVQSPSRGRISGNPALLPRSQTKPPSEKTSLKVQKSTADNYILLMNRYGDVTPDSSNILETTRQNLHFDNTIRQKKREGGGATTDLVSEHANQSIN